VAQVQRAHPARSPGRSSICFGLAVASSYRPGRRAHFSYQAGLIRNAVTRSGAVPIFQVSFQ
jgi:hypothetical protein